MVINGYCTVNNYLYSVAYTDSEFEEQAHAFKSKFSYLD